MKIPNQVDLLQSTARTLRMSRSALKPILDGFIKEIRALLVTGHSVAIRDLGTLTPSVGLHPSPFNKDLTVSKTATPQLAARISFKASRSLKQEMREGHGE